MSTSFPLPNVDRFSKPYFFFSSKPDFEIVYVSTSVEDVLGFQPAELIGRKCTDFLDSTSPMNDDIDTCKRMNRLPIATQQNSVWVVETKDSENKVLRIQTYRTQDDSDPVEIRHALAQDVTDVFFKEQELHRRLVELKRISHELSDREIQVLNFVIDGKLNKWIARKIGVTERTIENVRSRVMTKFQTETTAELAAKAKELHVLTEVVTLFNGSIGKQPIFLPQSQPNYSAEVVG